MFALALCNSPNVRETKYCAHPMTLQNRFVVEAIKIHKRKKEIKNKINETGVRHYEKSILFRCTVHYARHRKTVTSIEAIHHELSNKHIYMFLSSFTGINSKHFRLAREIAVSRWPSQRFQRKVNYFCYIMCVMHIQTWTMSLWQKKEKKNTKKKTKSKNVKIFNTQTAVQQINFAFRFVLKTMPLRPDNIWSDEIKSQSFCKQQWPTTKHT